MKTEQKSEFYCDGGLKNSGEYILGTNIRTGKWRTYFSNGNVESEGYYENDKKIGEWTYYFQNGGFKSTKFFQNGIKIKEKSEGGDNIDESDNM